MSDPFIPIETADLAWRDGLPFSRLFDDIYFSTENGLQEADHVFIQGNNLLERWRNLTEDTFVIAETGFGSGLNFLLTWSLWLKYAPKHTRLHFISCEKYPLTAKDLAQCLMLWPDLEEQAQKLLADYPVLTPGFHYLSFDDGRINLHLMLGDVEYCFNQLLSCGEPILERQLRTNPVDAWFLDGFAPVKNKAMWSESLFYMIGLLSKKETTLATFSSAGIVKKNLQAIGFDVNKIKGFAKKREMITARFKGVTEVVKPNLRTTPWHVDVNRKVRDKRAIVLGAGLAGCYTAYALAKRGWNVSLIDAANEVGTGASGNTQAVFYPKLSGYQSPLTLFMLSAFLFAHRSYKKLLFDHPVGNLSGILQLAFNDKERTTQVSLERWLSHYPELGMLVNEQQASELAGINLSTGGLFIPFSGWLDSKSLCQLLSQTPGINWVPDTTIKELKYINGQWHAADFFAEVLVIANGYQAAKFMQTDYIPLKPIQGQMTSIAVSQESSRLKIPLCGDGHILPEYHDLHALGATYHLGSSESTCCLADDRTNLSRLKKISAGLAWSEEVKSHWSAVRGATTDYLPIVGPVPEKEVFMERFATLKTNAKRWIPLSGAYYPGLYICAGFGSRGLTTVPLSSEWLASLINNEPSFIPRILVQALSPARFLRKNIIKK
ncbi:MULTISPECIES: bifunctional tRNA (5-methylaminomethyl-2-thiouridine)(34)-methyltransferase MnmD/FAD-dependent 5-carboxymethylaminomethyl-2-thiouridine(34) oxidoreductase MnmC [unclassified Legionella]|uniref:bifunctional tRNA (5-methylaminomethyl-2-thiouridine)(34)-methyltransferase MnmD/FAD-dependent 5-carboxymethylaminomethyl-2-thiouridine(34) oxidoreductase MnmC n=1 Tax=unclassified Legionella TaxID=2622702 RepID=UPI001056B010|nr:bifunctional tRNA (5-methylaminomethyl-2-thiouridine)(34)-methyltransferase MnmD/FAD-dependent 5-carboxymethylaminomethyl-2-thiouridine(34) oxidoreductase MnmC [Legionella sp. W10-070]MDI9818875.1 bifunctional tRNA (5-methylaminomethyl-2-thiouridine)(34)-methyltransferase MnmD/FAD-dependent 5-carboxymethylaminomethyl-2-thiouridine(34) oxidoreductase MnmC [Legionella sp. PL877]